MMLRVKIVPMLLLLVFTTGCRVQQPATSSPPKPDYALLKRDFEAQLSLQLTEKEGVIHARMYIPHIEGGSYRRTNHAERIKLTMNGERVAVAPIESKTDHVAGFRLIESKYLVSDLLGSRNGASLQLHYSYEYVSLGRAIVKLFDGSKTSNTLEITAPKSGTGTTLALPPEKLTPDERAFRKKLSGAQLKGRFSEWAVRDGKRTEKKALAKDTYTIAKVEKLGTGVWMFHARIQYGGVDLTLPIPVQVEWAGHTPVIVVDNLGMPGLGTYSARVLFHGDQYAGTWSGGWHGGQIFGTVVRAKDKEETAGKKAPQAPVGTQANPP